MLNFRLAKLGSKACLLLVEEAGFDWPSAKTFIINRDGGLRKLRKSIADNKREAEALIVAVSAYHLDVAVLKKRSSWESETARNLDNFIERKGYIPDVEDILENYRTSVRAYDLSEVYI